MNDRRQKLLAKYKASSTQRLARIDAILAQIFGGRIEEATVNELMRELHTLKGESRVVQFQSAAELAHRLEDLLAWARARQFQIAAGAADLCYLGLDMLRRLVLACGTPEADARAGESEQIKERIRGMLEERPAGDAAPGGTSDPTLDLGPRLTATPEEPQEAAEAAPDKQGWDDVVRLSSKAMAALTTLSGDLLLRQEAMAHELRQLHTELGAPKERAAAGGLRLSDRVRNLRDAGFELQLRLRELQEQVRQARLLRVRELFERYPPSVRDLSRELGKRVRVVLEGDNVAVDKQVLDVVDDALLHLTRNAVDHGLELPDDRRRAGKPEQGTVVLSARQLGAFLEISVQDDGRGVDVDKVRASARDKGLLTEAAAAQLDIKGAIELLFTAGFSTAAATTQTSGRGVGLDVVRQKLEALGGSVRVASRWGQGTTVVLTAPISVALSRLVLFKEGGTTFAIGSTHVVSTQRVRREELRTTAGLSAINFDGAPVPFIALRQLLGATSANPDKQEIDVVILEHAAQRLGVEVDHLLGERQAVQHGAGSLLNGHRLVAGAVFLEGGGLAVALNVPEILRLWGQGHESHTLQGEAYAPVRSWRALLVDDSEVTRDMLVSMFRQLGFETVEAINGKDALAKISAGLPDIVITDLDMPVMDGFAFIAALRSSPTGAGLPVVVLTTRGSDEDKRRALEAGASGYLVKTEVGQQVLRETVQRFLGVERAG